jgi:hypothetical protein
MYLPESASVTAGDRAATVSVHQSVVSSPDQPPASIGTRRRFMVISIF